MYVADKIKELILNGDNYNDIAIMYRANHISRGFEEQLMRYRIPYKIYGGLSFFSRAEIKDMIAYLRLLVLSNDDFSFKRIVNNPKRGIGKSILDKLAETAYENNLSLYDAIPYYKGKGQGAEGLKTFKMIIDSIKATIENVKLTDLIDTILEETGYADELRRTEDDEVAADKLNNIKEFKSVLKDADEESDKSNSEKLINLLGDLALRTNNDDNNDGNSVILTTYHQAKGLEFKDVFMVANEEGVFPSSNSALDEEIEEERRICYVGITRAKKNLFLTYCNRRRIFGYDTDMEKSRFIAEMDDELLDDNRIRRKKVEIKNTPIIKKEEQKTETNLPYELKTGDKINHKIFGDGIIVSREGNTITVAFKAEVGIKKLNANHPSIRKI